MLVMGCCDMCDALHLPHSYYPYTETLSQSLTNGPDRLVRFSIVLTACGRQTGLTFISTAEFQFERSTALQYADPHFPAGPCRV
jgi:hypothetical protein